MNIKPTDKVSFPELDLTVQSYQIGNDHSSITLQQQNGIQDANPLSPSQINLTASPSIWKRFTSLLRGTNSSTAENDSVEQINHLPISVIPTVDTPANISEEILKIKLPPASKKRKGSEIFTQDQVAEGLSLMSGQTQMSIEALMISVYQSQIEMQIERAQLAEDSVTKYAEIQKLMQEAIPQVRDILAKDSKILGYFKTVQGLTLAATFACGITAIAAGVGILPVGMLTATVTTIGRIAPAASAIATAFKSYFEGLTAAEQANCEKITYQDKFCNRQIEEENKRLLSLAENSYVFEEHWKKMLDKHRSISNSIFRK